MIIRPIFMSILSIVALSARAEEACWEVVFPQPYDYSAKQAIKINKCTGETWMLLPTLDKNGKITTDTWVPIQTQKSTPRT